MFGYLNIQKDKMSDGERGLWQTFMCGLCMSSKRFFSSKARLVVNNDINFFNVLFHSFLQMDVEIEQKNCISHPIKKRTILKTNDLIDRLAIANVLLVNFNLLDDVLDTNRLKHRLVHAAFQRDYRKARDMWTELDAAIDKYYQELRTFEKSGGHSLDKICHPFAQLTRKFAEFTLAEQFNDTMGDLCYNVGKWIYLIDALDDIKRDFSKRDYNAFADYYKIDKIDDINAKKEEVQFVMFAVLNRIAICYNDLNLTKYHCILENVVYHSMRNKTEQVLAKY